LALDCSNQSIEDKQKSVGETRSPGLGMRGRIGECLPDEQAIFMARPRRLDERHRLQLPPLRCAGPLLLGFVYA